MSVTNSVIEEELQTIQSIFPDDLHKEVNSNKAWKGAAMPPSFTLRVASDDPELEAHVYFTLHVQYSKTYPIAPATFTIKGPMDGLSPEHVKTLSASMLKKSKELANNKQEMVFDIRQLAVDFITEHHTYKRPTIIVPESAAPSASLAVEMKARAESAERAQKALAEKEEDGLRRLEQERASRLENEMQLDKKRRDQKLKADQERKQARERFLEREHDDTTERFTTAIKLDDGKTFNTVKILMWQEGILGKVSPVEPMLDNSPSTNTAPPLELLSIVFSSPYYNRSQGKKRLREIEHEIQGLRALRHPNLARLYAAELKKNHDDVQTLSILTDRTPKLTLKDVLDCSDVIRPDKAVEYLLQILSAVDALTSFQPENNHDRVKYCHRAICLVCIGIVKDARAKFGSRIQVGRAFYHSRLLNQHKSNAFDGSTSYHEENPVPRQWMSREAEDAPHNYNQRRDIWDVGIIMLQMLLGGDVMTQYPSVWNALEALNGVAVSDSLRGIISSMFEQSKKSNLTCADLIQKLKDSAREPSKELENGAVVGGPRSPSSPMVTFRQGVDYLSGSVSSLMPPPLTSRYREEWEEIEFLGKGGFGSVVKARFKLDGAIYAVKKIKLRGENDGKIYREINALSRLNHRFIVRYHTTWIETTGPISGFESPTGSSDQSTSLDATSPTTNGYRRPSRRSSHPLFREYREELSLGGSFSGSVNTTTSFPSIHFGHSDDAISDDEENTEDDEDGELTESMPPEADGEDSSSEDETPSNSRTPSRSRSRHASMHHSPARRAPQILYIQMEYVERQTLKEAIEDGLSEKDGWRLFRQILEALAHIASLGIIHRDIKLTNIFIGASGDVKVGDFGLATSSLASIDPSDVAKSALQPSLDITYGVGTRLYTAPEVMSRSRGHANHAKADMYSLGIVFFEMCWPPFQTDTERIEVIEKLRLPTVNFPPTWQGKERQRVIINKLLRHNPADRPSALELSNSSLLPEQEEGAYFEEARRKIQNSDEQCEIFISELFQRKFDDVKQLSYDAGVTPPEHSSLNDIVQEHLEQLFRLHGAVHKEPLLLIPITEAFDDEHQPVKLLDSAGRAVYLPRDHIVGFARLAVPSKDVRTPVRVKRFHVGNVYLPSPTGKQPIPKLAAMVDIIHTDLNAGAAEAELIRIANESLNLFPGVNTHQYEIYVSHSDFADHVFSRIAERTRRRDVSIVLSGAKPWTQKRAHLTKLGLPRIVVDEMEILSEDVDDPADMLERLVKIGGSSSRVANAVEEVTRTISLAKLMGVTRPLIFRPFISLDQPYFREGITFEVRGPRRGGEPLARGGRYDHLIAKYAGTSFKNTRAIGMQMNLEPLVMSLAETLSVSVPRLMKEQKSFGYWSPSRCDVYVVSFQKGLMAERIELTAMLWSNGIRADIMYESAIDNTSDPMAYVNMCSLEGILFMVWYRPKSANRDHPVYKVKSILKKTEHEVSLQELVPWLTERIAEQRRADLGVSGSKGSLIAPPGPAAMGPSSSRDSVTSNGPNVQVIVSTDSYGKKTHQKHKIKLHHADRAYAVEAELRSSISAGLPVIAVDISAKALEALTTNTAWVHSDAAWKALLSEYKDDLQPGIAQQLREAITKKTAEGSGQSKMVGLMALKDDRVILVKV